MRISIVVFLLFSVIFFGSLDAKSNGNECTQGAACQPWEKNKPCTRGQRMDLRYGVRRSVSGNLLAFGFCPIVDELQAFNLTRVGSVLSGLEEADNVTVLVYGQGEAANPTKDLSNAAFLAGKSDRCEPDQLAVATILILRFSMTRGSYTYGSNTSYPDQTGFIPTCDKHDHCSYAPNNICIGPVGYRNCASCYAVDTLASTRTTIWASYRGTGNDGRMFKSGDLDLMLFHKFGTGNLVEMLTDIGG